MKIISLLICTAFLLGGCASPPPPPPCDGNKNAGHSAESGFQFASYSQTKDIPCDKPVRINSI